MPKREQKNVVHGKLSRKTVFFIILGLTVSVSVALYILFFTGPTFKTQLTQVLQKKPDVSLKTADKNPFKKETQFVNPFDSTKSPFYRLKEEIK